MGVNFLQLPADQIREIFQEAFRSHRSVMVQMPTGTGKTVVLASLVNSVECGVRNSRANRVESRACSSYPEVQPRIEGVSVELGCANILIVAHRREMVEQIRDTIHRLGIDDGNITVCSIQWLTYNINKVAIACSIAWVRYVIGNNVSIAYRDYFCTGTHDIHSITFDIDAKPIVIEDECWIPNDIFVGPGVTIGKGTVVGARSTILKNLPAGMICYGNPAKPIKERGFSK